MKFDIREIGNILKEEISLNYSSNVGHVVTQPVDHLDIRPPFFKLAFIMKL